MAFRCAVVIATVALFSTAAAIQVQVDEVVHRGSSYRTTGTRSEAQDSTRAPSPLLALGKLHTAVVKSDGTVWTVGDNEYGKLGDGGESDRSTFAMVLAGAQAVALGGVHTAVLKSDGTVWTVGRAYEGMLGDGGGYSSWAGSHGQVSKSTFVEVLAGAQAVALGDSNTVVLKSDGTVWTVGKGSHGTLGDGTGYSRGTFAMVMAGAQAVDASEWCTAILKSDGTVWTVGADAFGQLGNGGTAAGASASTRRKTFEEVAAGAQAVALGEFHAAVLKSDGTVWTTGRDQYGQLCDGGGNTDRETFAQVLAGAQGVALGGSHSAVLKNDGTLWTCGQGWPGQLGDGGSTTNRGTFVEVLAGALAVALGRGHTGVLRSDGTVWTVGLNKEGQLGDGGPTTTMANGWTSHRNTFVQVTGDVRPATAAAPADSPEPPAEEASAVDDPHVMSLAGEKFTIGTPSMYTLVRFPKNEQEPALFEVRANVSEEPQDPCKLYIKAIELAGAFMRGSVAQVLPLARDVAGSNSAGTVTQRPLTLVVQSGGSRTNTSWERASQEWVAGRALTPKVDVRATIKDGLKKFQEGKQFDFVIESKMHVTIQQGSHQALNIKLSGIGGLWEGEIGGLLGTSKHSHGVEEPTDRCRASKAAGRKPAMLVGHSGNSEAGLTMAAAW